MLSAGDKILLVPLSAMVALEVQKLMKSFGQYGALLLFLEVYNIESSFRLKSSVYLKT